VTGVRLIVAALVGWNVGAHDWRGLAGTAAVWAAFEFGGWYQRIGRQEARSIAAEAEARARVNGQLLPRDGLRRVTADDFTEETPDQ